MQLKWTEPAAADLYNIETFIAEENSPVVAAAVVLKVIDAAEMMLSSHPQAGRLGRVKGTRELVVGGLPFIVIYRWVADLQHVHILRVLHTAQQWPPAKNKGGEVSK